MAGELLEKRLSKLGLSIHTAVELQEVLCNQGVRFVRLKKPLEWMWMVGGWMRHQSYKGWSW